MTRPLSLSFAVLLALAGSLTQAQDVLDVPTSDYVRLLKATRYVENYKQMAAVAARVSGSRGQGSDKEYARFMAVVATADLSDIEECLVGVYRAQNLTKDDIDTLVTFFESPLGSKLLEQSNRMMIADIERGSHQPMPPDTFTNEEKEGLQEMQKNISFRKYGMMTTDKAFGGGIMKCLAQSDAVKKSGIKF